jgi:hypothetical protein
MKQRSSLLSALLIANSFAEAQNVLTTPLPIPVQGETKLLQGKATTTILPVQGLNLYMDGSTPEKPILNPEAEYYFKLFGAILVERGQTFFTCLRPEWDLPRLIWTVASSPQ